jgi:hypothetical protein
VGQSGLLHSSSHVHQSLSMPFSCRRSTPNHGARRPNFAKAGKQVQAASPLQHAERIVRPDCGRGFILNPLLIFKRMPRAYGTDIYVISAGELTKVVARSTDRRDFKRSLAECPGAACCNLLRPWLRRAASAQGSPGIRAARRVVWDASRAGSPRGGEAAGDPDSV